MAAKDPLGSGSVGKTLEPQIGPFCVLMLEPQKLE